MIIKLKGGDLKSVRMGQGIVPRENELFVPDEWGTDEFLEVFFECFYKSENFSIKEDFEEPFKLFEVTLSKGTSGEHCINPFDSECSFTLFEVTRDKELLCETN